MRSCPLGVFAAALLAAVLPACREPEPPALRIAHESDVLSFDPTIFPESATASILGNFYESLVAFDPDIRIAPALAVSWLTMDDNTWLFQIRKGVRFHDGFPLTASDVQLSLERARKDPASGVKGYLSAIASVEVVGDAVRVRTSRPDPLLLNRLTYVFIVPASRLLGGFPRPMGTGPYRFVSREPGVYLDAEAFPDYWGGRPPIARVRFLPVAAQQVVRTLRGDAVDVLRWVPEEAMREAPTLGNVRIVNQEGLSAYFLWLNPKASMTEGRNPLFDGRVRRAISLAVDRQALTQQPERQAAALNQLVHGGIFGFVPDLPPLAHDPGAARALLAEAGYPRGFEMPLVFRENAGLDGVVQALCRMLGEVGIRVRPQPMEWQRLLTDAWLSRRVPLFLAGWQFDEVDAWGFLRDCIYTPDPSGTYGAYNPGYSDPEIDRLIEAGDRIFDRSQRLAHYRALMRLALQEMPLVPLYSRQDVYAVSHRVRWRPRLDGSLRAAEMAWATAPPP